MVRGIPSTQNVAGTLWCVSTLPSTGSCRWAPTGMGSLCQELACHISHANMFWIGAVQRGTASRDKAVPCMVWGGGLSLQAGAQSCHLLISPCFISSVQFEPMRGGFQSVPSVHLHVEISKARGKGPTLGICSLKKITGLFLEQSCIATPKATDSSAHLALHLHIMLG